MSQDYVSNELFHFVGRATPTDHESNYDILRRVIEARTVSHPPHEEGWGETSYQIEWNAKLEDGELIVPTVTCFCDIPFSQLSVHVTKYGCFGLSFDRALLVRYGARPVIYVPLGPEDLTSPFGRQMLRDIEQVYRSFRNQVADRLNPVKEARQLAAPLEWNRAYQVIAEKFEKDFLAFIKPFRTDLRDHDPDNFYMEREWRKFGNLQFDPEDVHRVIVEDSYLTRARADFPELADRVIPACVGGSD